MSVISLELVLPGPSCYFVAAADLKQNVGIFRISRIENLEHVRADSVGRRPNREFIKHNLDVDFDREISIHKIVLGSFEDVLSFGKVLPPSVMLMCSVFRGISVK